MSVGFGGLLSSRYQHSAHFYSVNRGVKLREAKSDHSQVAQCGIYVICAMREAIHRLESEGEGWRQSTSFVLQAVREDCDFGVRLLSGRLGCWRYMCCSRSQTFSSPTIVGRQRLQLAYMDPLPLGESCFSEEICRLRVLAAPRPGPGRSPGSLPPADLLSNDRMGISWSARQSARLRCPATSELQGLCLGNLSAAQISPRTSLVSGPVLVLRPRTQMPTVTRPCWLRVLVTWPLALQRWEAHVQPANVCSL